MPWWMLLLPRPRQKVPSPLYLPLSLSRYAVPWLLRLDLSSFRADLSCWRARLRRCIGLGGFVAVVWVAAVGKGVIWIILIR